MVCWHQGWSSSELSPGCQPLDPLEKVINFLKCLVVFLCFKNFKYVHSLQNLRKMIYQNRLCGRQTFGWCVWIRAQFAQVSKSVYEVVVNLINYTFLWLVTLSFNLLEYQGLFGPWYRHYVPFQHGLVWKNGCQSRLDCLLQNFPPATPKVNDLDACRIVAFPSLIIWFNIWIYTS